MGLLLLAGARWMAIYGSIVFLGVFYGATIVLQALLWANYFGRLSLGRVQSLAMPISAAFTPLGPILAGYLWDFTGSYKGIFTAYIGAQAVAALLILQARPPRKPAPIAGVGIEPSLSGR